MSNETTRRRFLGGMLLAGAALPLGWGMRAVEPLSRPGGARLRLSLAAYSFRQFFSGVGPGADGGDKGRQLDMFRFIDYCAEWGCDAAELTSYYFPPEVDDAYLLRVRRHAFLRGMEISGTAVGNRFTWPRGAKLEQEIAGVKRWIDRASALGAPHIRIFAGDRPEGMSQGEAKAICIESIAECCEYAGWKGIMLGLENHGGIVAEPEDLLEIVRAVDSPWFGVNLDTGNFHTADPYADLERCLPYAVNVQVKVEMQARGTSKGPADLERLVGMLRAAGYQGYVALEYEAAADPWEAVPAALGRMKRLMTS